MFSKTSLSCLYYFYKGPISSLYVSKKNDTWGKTQFWTQEEVCSSLRRNWLWKGPGHYSFSIIFLLEDLGMVLKGLGFKGKGNLWPNDNCKTMMVWPTGSGHDPWGSSIISGPVDQEDGSSGASNYFVLGWRFSFLLILGGWLVSFTGEG